MEELRRLSLDVYARAAEHAESQGIILADTKFEFGRDKDGRIVLADEVLTPDSSRFWPADQLRARPLVSPRSTSSTCATGSTNRAGTTLRPAPSFPPTSSQATRAKYVEAYERIAGESRSIAGSARLRVRVLIRPKEGILDPQGQAVERALPALGYEDVSNVHVGRLVELDVRRGRRRRGAGARDVRAAAGEPADRELRSPGSGRDSMSAGSASSSSPAPATRRMRSSLPSAPGLEPEYLWHADARPQGRRRP